MDIRVEVFNQQQCDDEWPSENAIKFLTWFNEKINLIPEEFRHSAKVVIESQCSYENSSYPSIEIYYYRPARKEELKAMELKEKVKMERLKQEELKRLEELKRRYEA